MSFDPKEIELLQHVLAKHLQKQETVDVELKELYFKLLMMMAGDVSPKHHHKKEGVLIK